MTNFKTLLATVLMATAMTACTEAINTVDKPQEIPTTETHNTDTHKVVNEDTQTDNQEEIVEDAQLVVNEDPDEMLNEDVIEDTDENTQEDIDTSTFEPCEPDDPSYGGIYELYCVHNPADFTPCADLINICDNPEVTVHKYLYDNEVAIITVQCSGHITIDKWACYTGQPEQPVIEEPEQTEESIETCQYTREDGTVVLTTDIDKCKREDGTTNTERNVDFCETLMSNVKTDCQATSYKVEHDSGQITTTLYCSDGYIEVYICDFINGYLTLCDKSGCHLN